MKTPFTTGQFIGVFEPYKTALFPLQWMVMLAGFAAVLNPLKDKLTGGIPNKTTSPGLPCPTSLMTFGFFMPAKNTFSRHLLIIPLVWAMIGLSGAINSGVYKNFMIIVPAAAAVFVLVRKRNQETIAANPSDRKLLKKIIMNPHLQASVPFNHSGILSFGILFFTLFIQTSPLFSQSHFQLTAATEFKANSSWPASAGVSEYTFENEVCNLTYDSVSGKILVGLMTKERMAKTDPWWKRYEQLPDPDEYKRWFPEPWMKIYPDYVSCIDPFTQKETWTLEVRKIKNMSRFISEDDFIYVDQGLLLIRNSIFDIQSGKIRLHIKNEPIFGLIPGKDLVLSVGSGDNVYCRNLSNGSIRWKFKPEHAGNGWNDLVKINDSTLVLSASGLHFLNITNGRFAYNPASTVDDVTKVVGPFGDRYGPEQLLNFHYSFGNGMFASDRIWGLASNVVYDNRFVYAAGHNDITCSDHTGRIIWNVLTDSMASGRLILSDSLLVYINKGYGIIPVYDFWIRTLFGYRLYRDYEGYKTLYSVPCIRIYNRFNGDEVLSQNLSGFVDAIIDVRNIPGNDTIHLLTRNKIIITDISAGRNLAVKEYCAPGTGDMCSLASQDVWLMNSEGIFFPAGTTASYPAIRLDTRRIWQHDKHLNNVNIHYRDNIWYYMGKAGNISVIANNHSVLLLDVNGKELAKIPSGGPVCLAGSKLMMAEGNRIHVLDLKLFPQP